MSAQVPRVCVFNASWSTFGGGEKYLCTLADTLAATGRYDVTILADRPDITKEQLRRYFNLTLDHVTVEPVQRRDVSRRLSAADIGIIVSNFRPFGNRARRNVYVLQIPYPRINPLRIIARAARGEPREAAKDVLRKSLLGDARAADLVLVYSEFVRNVLLHAHHVGSHVLYPSIDDFKTERRKENVILSVGRFFSGLYNDKRYDVLIESFKQLRQRLPHASWEYRLIGSCGSDRPSRDYVESLRASAKGFPIYFHVNASYDELRRHYNEASLFWHAAGYGADERRHPERTEHFGMSTVEAMSAECVPLVVDRGGQKEIVSQGESGYLWDTPEQLVERTIELMADPALLRRMQQRARSRFREFDRDHFTQHCLSLFNQMEVTDHGKK